MDRLRGTLACAEELSKRNGLGLGHRDAVFFAILFHRLVSKPSAPPVESARASVEAWRSFVSEAGIHAPSVELVAQLIEQSAALPGLPAQALPADGPAAAPLAVFLDCVWSTLGESEARYARSVAELRLESSYEHDETGATFAQGRMALLEEMLRRDAIFRCKATDEAELEARARKNVDAELKRLTQRA